MSQQLRRLPMVSPNLDRRYLHMTGCHLLVVGWSTLSIVNCQECYPQCPVGGIAGPSVFLLFMGFSESCNGWVFCSSVKEMVRLWTKDSTAMGICSPSLLGAARSAGSDCFHVVFREALQSSCVSLRRATY